MRGSFFECIFNASTQIIAASEVGNLNTPVPIAGMPILLMLLSLATLSIEEMANVRYRSGSVLLM
jgi:hypothetical protein